MGSSNEPLAEVARFTRDVFITVKRDNGTYSWLCPYCYAMGAVQFNSTTPIKEVHQDEAIHRTVCDGG